MTMIVAISSPPGGGKTTLLDTLARRLPAAAAISYDDYQQITNKSMDEILAWLDSGAALDFIEVPLLAEHLGRLKAGEAVQNPATGSWVKPAPIVLFETPLGRAHQATGQYIDTLIWLDLPLDLALARKLHSFTLDFLRTPQQGLVDEMRWLSGYLEHYQLGTHRALMLQQERVRSCRVDCQLDGMLSIDVLAQQVIEWLGQTGQ